MEATRNTIPDEVLRQATTRLKSMSKSGELEECFGKKRKLQMR